MFGMRPVAVLLVNVADPIFALAVGKDARRRVGLPRELLGGDPISLAEGWHRGIEISGTNIVVAHRKEQASAALQRLSGKARWVLPVVILKRALVHRRHHRQ